MADGWSKWQRIEVKKETRRCQKNSEMYRQREGYRWKGRRADTWQIWDSRMGVLEEGEKSRVTGEISEHLAQWCL